VTSKDAQPASPDAGPPAEPVLPDQSREDTDEGWGEYPERDDDWLQRDRPPHWSDF
jgi:hypothetical protein